MAIPTYAMQVGEVIDSSHWRCVHVIGRAEKLTKRGEMERAMKQIVEVNPLLTPAINPTQVDAWGRAVDIATLPQSTGDVRWSKNRLTGFLRRTGSDLGTNFCQTLARLH